MRVAIIGSRGMHSSYGGIERVLGQLCPRLAAMGHEIDVFGEEDDGDVGTKAPHAARSIRVPGLRGKYTETISRSFLATALSVARRYDVINLVAIGPGILSVLPRLVGIPVVVSVHGLDWRRDKWPLPARMALQAAERAIVSCAHEITVVSRQLQEHFRGTYGRDVVYTPNGVEIRTGAADPALLQSIGLEPGEYVLFASRLVREKAAHEIIEAFNRVETEKKLVIAGDGRYDQSYVDSLRQADRTGRCVFTGHLTGASLDAVFKGAYLYALPSHIEGLSLSLLEAMGYGKAALVSDIAENLEVVGDCAFQFPVGRVDLLAENLARLLHAPREVDEMARRAQGRASQLYSWDSVAAQYSDLYETIGRRRSGLKKAGAPQPPVLDDRR